MNSLNKDLMLLLEQGLSKLNIITSSDQNSLLIKHLELIIKWNVVHNLTAITDMRSMIVKHVLDSLSIAKYLHGNSFIDIGTGAGFPGIPLAICYPSKHFVLLDSNHKKILFLQHTQRDLNINNIDIVKARVENYESDSEFDGFLFRAFADVNKILKQVKHLKRENGKIYLMIGHVSDSIEKIINSRDCEIIKLEVPQLQEVRHLLIVD